MTLRERVFLIVQERGPITPREIGRLLGGRRVEAQLSSLLADGYVTAFGRTHLRLYSADANIDPPPDMRGRTIGSQMALRANSRNPLRIAKATANLRPGEYRKSGPNKRSTPAWAALDAATRNLSAFSVDLGEESP